MEECGQECIDEWRRGIALASKDVIDWVKENGGEILIKLIGIDDLKKCLSKRDVGSCLWTLLDVATIVLAVGKLPAVEKAVSRVASGIAKFFEESAEGKRIVEKYRELLEKLKKGEKTPTCPVKPRAAISSAPPAMAAGGWDDYCTYKLPVELRGRIPSLDVRSIEKIRQYHFPGGQFSVSSKGLFKDTITNSDPHKILDKGLSDAAEFVRNKDGYFEKTFKCTGVGYSSTVKGGNPADFVTVVIETGGGVVTMFPV
ncbi:hypothetical protein AB0M57_31465 [Streptomyces sp. NPDC051597]|uniref:hypothetical protein n=1 Tax=Streptomyces sp. NPDC051597 TaxID=3155049 RepID=UPI0034482039